MKYIIISERKDAKKDTEMESFILLDTFSQCYYHYDSSDRGLKRIILPLKRFIVCGSPKYNLYISSSDKILINEETFKIIINMKIKQIHLYNLNDFLRRFQLYEWMI
jgi:hypothetical protein